MMLTARSGAMLLMTTLIVGAAALVIGLSVSITGISELDMGFSEHRGQEAMAIADGCVQEAMLRLARDSGYTGASGMTVGSGACDITVSGSGDERVISVDATLGNWMRSITVQVDLSQSPIAILDWDQE